MLIKYYYTYTQAEFRGATKNETIENGRVGCKAKKWFTHFAANVQKGGQIMCKHKQGMLDN